MKSELEKFVSQNAKELDTETPSNKVWDAIEKNIAPAKKEKVFLLKDIYKWSAAAAVLFMLLTTAYFVWVKVPKTVQQGQTELAKIDTVLPPQKVEDTLPNEIQNVPINLATIPPEYVSEAKMIHQTIDVKKEKLKSATKEDPKLCRQFADDLKTLDSTYKMLEMQAETSPNRDVIIKAMMQNLALKAELLARQLSIINEFKNTKNEKNNSSIL